MLKPGIQVLSAVTVGLAGVGVAHAAKGVNSEPLRDAVTIEAVLAHEQEFQDFANASGGTRHASSPGFFASVDYVADLMDAAGYDVTIQDFDYAFFQETAPAALEQVLPDPTVYTETDDFLTMEYSGSGDVTADAQAVDVQLPPGPTASSSTSGCEASDFTGFTPGNIAIIQRGTCDFVVKAQNAEAAGAVGVVIFNEGQPGRTETLNGTLGGPGVTIPVVGTSFAVGEELAAADVVRVSVTATSEIRQSQNVIAESPGGRNDRVVVVGAHLDSVPEGPGINDNGSGSAAILEVALQMSELGINPRNKVRFTWWGAEESGLLGSEFYVSQLTKREIKNIAANLNFDMVGSPNFVRFVYDGDGSATETAGPNGSDTVEQVFLKYFRNQGLATEPTAFDGRSDYGPFIAVGIPAGGLFTGAEGIKSDEEAAIYGGTAGIAYDPCYHQACDAFPDNLNNTVLDQMSDAVAHSVLTFAMTTSAVNGTDKANARALKTISESLTFKGPHLKK